jgi:hypothetical protein
MRLPITPPIRPGHRRQHHIPLTSQIIEHSIVPRDEFSAIEKAMRKRNQRVFSFFRRPVDSCFLWPAAYVAAYCDPPLNDVLITDQRKPWNPFFMLFLPP